MEGRLLRLERGVDHEWRVTNDLKGVAVSEAQIPKNPKSLVDHDMTPDSLMTFLTQLLADARFKDDGGTWTDGRLHAIGEIGFIEGDKIDGEWLVTVKVIIVRYRQS